MKIFGLDIRRAKKEQKKASSKPAKNEFIESYEPIGISAFQLRTVADTDIKVNYIVNAILKRIIDAVSSVKFNVVDKNTGELKSDSQLSELLNSPHQLITGQEFKKYVTAYYLIKGNVLIQKLRYGNELAPMKLLPHNPDNAELRKLEQNKIIKGVKDYYFAASKKTIKPEDMIHIKNINSDDIFWGKGELSILAEIVGSDRDTRQWYNELIQKGAKIPAVLGVKSPLEKKQQKDLEKTVDRYRFGNERFNKIMVLGSDFSLHQLSHNVNDLNIIAQQKLTAEQICVAMRVNPVVVGFSGGATYNNSKNFRIEFMEDRVMPIISTIIDSLNNDLSIYYPNLEIVANYDNVPALRGVYTQAVKDFSILVRTGAVLPKDAAIISGLPLAAEVLKNEYIEPSTRATQVKKADKMLEIKAYTKKEKRRIYEKNLQDRIAFEIAAEKIISDIFIEEKRLIQKAIKAGVGLDSALINANKIWHEKIVQLYRDGAIKFGHQTVRQLLDKYDLNYKFLFNQNLDSFIKSHAATQVRLVSNATRDRLAKLLLEARQANLTSSQIAKLVTEQYKSWAELSLNFNNAKTMSRAGLIARTETGIIIGQARHEATTQVEQEYNVQVIDTWVSSGDDRVRPSHIAVDGETIIHNQGIFSNGLRFPSDPIGDISEIANCRCDVVSEVVKNTMKG